MPRGPGDRRCRSGGSSPTTARCRSSCGRRRSAATASARPTPAPSSRPWSSTTRRVAARPSTPSATVRDRAEAERARPRPAAPRRPVAGRAVRRRQPAGAAPALGRRRPPRRRPATDDAEWIAELDDAGRVRDVLSGRAPGPPPGRGAGPAGPAGRADGRRLRRSPRHRVGGRRAGPGPPRCASDRSSACGRRRATAAGRRFCARRPMRGPCWRSSTTVGPTRPPPDPRALRCP